MPGTPPPYDVIIVGGGVNGAGAARDAAGRGARVLLIEAGDLAQGTSSKSTKLIHGGLRYLEHYEFGLVREALKEREILWGIAPHIIRPLRFVLPHRPGLRPRWLLRLGLFLYDHIGGRKKLPATRSIDLSRHVAGGPLQPQYRHGFEYSDGWVDDARLVVLNARDAADHGARVRTRTRAEMLRCEDGLWIVDARDELGHQYRFTGRSIVNAAGPAVLDLLKRADAEPDHQMRLVRGSHIVVRRIFEHDYAYFFQLPDGRIFFAIPYERDFTLIGTTDQDHDGPASEAKASDEEIAYLCEGASLYFRAPITPADVVWTYSGVRPLIEDGSGRPEAATRGYRIDLDMAEGAPLLTIYGGKITSYRHVAEAAVDALAGHIPALTGKDWTAKAPLPGGNFATDGAAALKAEYKLAFPFLTAATVDRIAQAYGTDARHWLADATDWAALGGEIAHGLSVAELRWMVTHEWARTTDDILWRRSKLGLHFTPDETARLAGYVERFAAEARLADAAFFGDMLNHGSAASGSGD
ncbi:glycerol-3-phosphate dehydrogenase [Sphingopyxis sp. RIFCSPHIGHO2_12_FULL_65_19]|uniref:glycerol-3-phosphate dehydrogenase n=1 Tax=Sphingopyxis sp. RIFCSPHIGHO2_12_FULL_65_19 TaxID=1802172 RepID=UPI0008D18287|nr:glycerol-3-phosphate dehydrogenase [Sphingopyxis sp. RIFCSPHIGHO2_12_FULL_65_19]OHD09390.1 MAG: glycerol-3-phosphate dehydrogenase [Sphingopyxis sp. RIFCSPHIGHO2_12_FULL_65_19]